MLDRGADADAVRDDDPLPVPRPRAANSGLPRFVGWTFAGIAMGLVVVLIFLRQRNYDPTPTLTPDRFEAAHLQWKAAAPPSYDIEVRVTGPQAATYRAQVRDGEPQAAWRNGQPLNSRRTFGTWSVPGMFATISRDVEAIERASERRAPPPLILRAEFDNRYGYPAKYRRIDNGSRKGGDAIAVTWDVVEFRIVK